MVGFLNIFIFFLGFVLILKGGDLLVESSVWFAEKTHIPPIIVGATIVSIATTFPETTVSVIASSKGNEIVAINTAIGAMVCNFALVLGLSFLLSPSKVKTESFLSKYLFFIVSIAVLFFVGLSGKLTIISAIILTSTFVIYVIINCIEAKRAEKVERINLTATHSWAEIVWQFAISAITVGLGANVLVENVDTIANMFNISQTVVGMTVIAVGTNIPELVTTFSSVKQGNSEIGIGNIFGASIINSTLLMSLATIVAPARKITLPRKELVITVISLLVITSIITFPILKRGKTNRMQGFLLLALYVIYSLLMA